MSHPPDSEILPPANNPRVQKDLDGTSTGMEGQQQDILNSKQPFAAQAEQLRTLEDRARKWAKKYLHKIKAAASKAEAAAGIPSPAPASGAGGSPAGSQTGVQRPAKAQSESAYAASAQLPSSERTPTKPARNGESADIRRPIGRQPISGRPVSRSVSRTPESTRGAGARSRLMDPIGGRATGRVSDPPRRSASRPIEGSGRSVNSVAGTARRSMSRPAESTTRTVRTTDSVRRSISRPVEGTIRSQSRPADIRPTRSVNRSTVDSRRSVSSRPADSTRSVSTARSVPRPGSSTATSSWRAGPYERSPAAEAPSRRTPQRASDMGTARNPPVESSVHRTTPDPDPQPRQPDIQSTEALPEASTRAAQEREAERQEAEELEAQQREIELRQAQQREDEQREAEQREAQRREIQRREAEQRQAELRAEQQLVAQRQEAKLREAQREVAAMRSPPAAHSHQAPYRNGATPPAAAPTSHVVPDLSPPTNGARGSESRSPSTLPNGTSPGKVRASVPAADGVAEALQGSQMEGAAIIDSVTRDKRPGSGSRDSHPVTNIRTNQMYQSIDAPDSMAEELLSATYASDTASMMSTMTGQEKTWGGGPAPKKKKTRTTFLNRLFSSKKASS